MGTGSRSGAIVKHARGAADPLSDATPLAAGWSSGRRRLQPPPAGNLQGYPLLQHSRGRPPRRRRGGKTRGPPTGGSTPSQERLGQGGSRGSRRPCRRGLGGTPRRAAAAGAAPLGERGEGVRVKATFPPSLHPPIAFVLCPRGWGGGRREGSRQLLIWGFTVGGAWSGNFRRWHSRAPAPPHPPRGGTGNTTGLFSPCRASPPFLAPCPSQPHPCAYGQSRAQQAQRWRLPAEQLASSGRRHPSSVEDERRLLREQHCRALAP